MKIGRIAMALAPAVLVAGCGAVERSSGSMTFETSPGTQSESGGERGSILDFTAPRLGGGSVTGAGFAGMDLALWFWAPW